MSLTRVQITVCEECEGEEPHLDIREQHPQGRWTSYDEAMKALEEMELKLKMMTKGYMFMLGRLEVLLRCLSPLDAEKVVISFSEDLKKFLDGNEISFIDTHSEIIRNKLKGNYEN